MKKTTKLTSLILTLALILGLTSSLTACNSVEEVAKSSFDITMSDSNNLSVKLMSSEVTVTNEGYLTKTLTATVSPATEYNQLVTWSVAWKNSQSAWAIGKSVTDYVEVIPKSEYSLTATVTCKQAFGEQVNVTVTSLTDSSKHATCVCDYERRLLDFNLTKLGVNEIYEVNGEKRIKTTYGRTDVTEEDITYNVIYSDYTLETEMSEFDMYLRLTDEFISKLGDYYRTSDPSISGVFGDIDNVPIDYSGDLMFNALCVTVRTQVGAYYDVIKQGGTVPDYLVPSGYFNKLLDYGFDKPIGHIVVVRTRGIGGGFLEYETLFEYPIYLDESITQMAVETVTLASNSIIF